jgi:tetratricopeptide (TPR) repeat protein
MKKIIIAIFLLFIISAQVSFLLTEASAQAGSQTDTLVVSGMAKQKAADYAGAIEDFTSAIKKNEPEVLKYLREIEAYDKKSAFDRAEQGIETPLIDINLAMPYYLRGSSYSAAGNTNEAINDFNTAIKINSKLGSAYYERGKVLWSMGKREEGCTDLCMAGGLKDSSAKNMFDAKFCWKEAVLAANGASSKIPLNDFQGALDEIQKAIMLCPDSARFFAIRGKAYLGLSKYELAMNDFDKAILLNQNGVDAYFSRGVAYYSKNKWQESFDDLAKAILLDEKFSDAYLYRAYVCEEMDKNLSALYDYQQVQRLKPKDPLAFYKSGLIRNTMNDPKACSDFRKAASMGYSDAQVYVNKCNAAEKEKGK